MRKLATIAAALFSLSFPTVVAAQSIQDIDDAMRAYNERDHATLRSLAAQGNSMAQYNLGFMYSNGEGVTKNDAKAARWYRLAAEQGNVPAQYNLGMMYYSGVGVLQNYIEAARWLRMSAEQGVAAAQGMLGWMYYDGKGVPQNYVIAYMWSNLAAAQDGQGGLRDAVAKSMTREDLARAQQMSQECLERNYQGCAR